MAKKKAPEELEHVWDEETQQAWNNLNPKQQDFLIAWLNNGYNASQAHWDTYDKTSNAATAAASGSRRLSDVNIQTICTKLTNDKASDLALIKKVYTDAMKADTPIFADGDKVMDIEDHKTRISAAEKLAKLNGELTEKVEHSGTVSIAQQIIDAHGE